MRLSGLRVLLLAAFCGAAQVCAAQAGPGKADTDKPADGVIQVKLGASAVALAGQWKFHTGDNPAWAQQEFNDSDWKTIDLTPPAGSEDASIGASGYIPGWTAQGFPDYTGYAWYRLHANLEGGSRGLSLKMPEPGADTMATSSSAVK